MSNDTVALKIKFVESERFNLLSVVNADNPNYRMHVRVPKGSNLYEALRFMGETSVNLLECFSHFDPDEYLSPDSVPGYSEDNQ